MKGLENVNLEKLIKIIEELKRRTSECLNVEKKESNVEKKANESVTDKPPQFTWLKVQTLKPEIGRNLALLGKPYRDQLANHKTLKSKTSRISARTFGHNNRPKTVWMSGYKEDTKDTM